MSKIFFSLLVLYMVILAPLARAQQAPIEDLILNPSDRILVLAPHPDDEVLGTGGVLQRAITMNLPHKVVFLTHGDSNQRSFFLYRKHPVIMPKAVKAMGLVRRDEAVTASGILGVNPKDLVFLGYPDFGTLNMWYAHWNTKAPYRSVLTRVTSVPYEGAYRPGASYKAEEVLSDLRALLRDFKPTKIFVSHPSDYNADHVSFYLYLRVALWDEQMEGRVQVYPYLIHYLGWPNPKGFKPKVLLKPPSSLANVNSWKQYRLTMPEIELKKAALLAHKTQYKSTPKALLSFIRPNELFGDFPAIKLHMNEDTSVFKAQPKVISNTELPDEYNSNEKSSFIGVEWKFVRWQGENLVVSIGLSKPLIRDVNALIYIFGYNKNVSFDKMPKISLRLGRFGYTLYDQNRQIEKAKIGIKRTPHDITLTIPLKLLGNPDRILTSARTYLDNVPLDSASWIAVELK